MNFDFLSGINTLGSGVLGILVPFLFVLTPVVFFHELGHFLVARWCGVKILVFSIGFGPELFGIQRSSWHPVENCRHSRSADT